MFHLLLSKPRTEPHLCQPNISLLCYQIDSAIAVCVRLNQWNLAVQLANTHHVPEIDSLLAKYATHLLSKGKVVDAIEV